MGSIPIGATFSPTLLTRVGVFFSAFTAKKAYLCGTKFYKCSTKKDMATFKAEVYAHQKKSDGTYNIKKGLRTTGRKGILPQHTM